MHAPTNDMDRFLFVLFGGIVVGDDVLGVPFKPIFVCFIRAINNHPYGVCIIEMCSRGRDSSSSRCELQSTASNPFPFIPYNGINKIVRHKR